MRSPLCILWASTLQFFCLCTTVAHRELSSSFTDVQTCFHPNHHVFTDKVFRGRGDPFEESRRQIPDQTRRMQRLPRPTIRAPLATNLYYLLAVFFVLSFCHLDTSSSSTPVSLSLKYNCFRLRWNATNARELCQPLLFCIRSESINTEICMPTELCPMFTEITHDCPRLSLRYAFKRFVT